MSRFLYAFGCTTPGRWRRVAAVPLRAATVRMPARWTRSGVRTISRDSGFGVRGSRFEVPGFEVPGAGIGMPACAWPVGVDEGADCGIVAESFESRVPNPESRP